MSGGQPFARKLATRISRGVEFAESGKNRAKEAHWRVEYRKQRVRAATVRKGREESSNAVKGNFPPFSVSFRLSGRREIPATQFDFSPHDRFAIPEGSISIYDTPTPWKSMMFLRACRIAFNPSRSFVQLSSRSRNFCRWKWRNVDVTWCGIK